MDRRHFIRHSLVTVAASACASSFRRWSFAEAPKRTLVLGGTHFLGPAIVEAAIGEGHIVTLILATKTCRCSREDNSTWQLMWPNDPPLARSG